MTKINFQKEHLHVITKALEVYYRLRMGQFRTAMDVAFSEYHLSWDELEKIEDFVKPIIFPENPQLQYDGHGGYYDQYGNSYDEEGNLIGEVTWEQKCREKRPKIIGKNAYYGIFSDVAKESGATLAYEISQTITQYLALTNNDGYSDWGTNFQDPLQATDTPLPTIDGFSKEKKFVIKGKAIVNKIQKAEEQKDWVEFWDIINNHLKSKHPELGGWEQARVEKDGVSYLIYTKNTKKKSYRGY